MSATFNQVVDLIDRNVDTDSESYPLADKVVDINLALDKVFSLIFQNSGTWQYDDSGHDDYPIIQTNLVSGQRDYTFVSDEQGNLILDIYKVLVADPNGVFYEVKPIDVEQGSINTSSFTDGLNIGGTPYRYDKMANGVLLDPVPNYSVASGLKVYINREASYFTEADTTKKPGFAGLFHEYLALRPAYQYAYRHGLGNAKQLQQEMLLMEDAIETYYSKRAKDEPQKLRTLYRSSR